MLLHAIMIRSIFLLCAVCHRAARRNVYQLITGETIKVFHGGGSLLFSQAGPCPGMTAVLLSAWAVMAPVMDGRSRCERSLYLLRVPQVLHPSCHPSSEPCLQHLLRSQLPLGREGARGSLRGGRLLREWYCFETRVPAEQRTPGSSFCGTGSRNLFLRGFNRNIWRR